MNAKDTESHLLLILMALLAYLTLPILFGSALYAALRLGAFPPESDAIAIPFAGFLMLWIFGLFVALAVGAIHAGRALIGR